MWSVAMRMSGLLVRFGLSYLAAIVVIGLVVDFLGLKSNSGFNMAALFAAAFFACGSFINKNKRCMESSEIRRAFTSMLMIDIVLQLSFLWLTGVGSAMRGSGLVLGAMVFVMVFHALAIYFSIRITNKQYRIQFEKQKTQQ
jgi:hypothetical protein